MQKRGAGARPPSRGTLPGPGPLLSWSAALPPRALPGPNRPRRRCPGCGLWAVAQAQDSGQAGQGAAGWHRPGGRRPQGVSGVRGAQGDSGVPGLCVFWLLGGGARPGARPGENTRPFQPQQNPSVWPTAAVAAGWRVGRSRGASTSTEKGGGQAFPPSWAAPGPPHPSSVEPARLSLGVPPHPSPRKGEGRLSGLGGQELPPQEARAERGGSRLWGPGCLMRETHRTVGRRGCHSGARAGFSGPGSPFAGRARLETL